MTLSDDERVLLVGVISGWLRRAGGDGGGMMLDAYYQISSETDQHVRGCMLELLESVRAAYVSAWGSTPETWIFPRPVTTGAVTQTTG